MDIKSHTPIGYSLGVVGHKIIYPRRDSISHKDKIMMLTKNLHLIRFWRVSTLQPMKVSGQLPGFTGINSTRVKFSPQPFNVLKCFIAVYSQFCLVSCYKGLQMYLMVRKSVNSIKIPPRFDGRILYATVHLFTRPFTHYAIIQ